MRAVFYHIILFLTTTPTHPRYLLTKVGVGYSLAAQPAAQDAQ